MYFIDSQSYQTLISSFFWFLLLSLAILTQRQYFQTLKLNNEKRKSLCFTKNKVWLDWPLAFLHKCQRNASGKTIDQIGNRAAQLSVAFVRLGNKKMTILKNIQKFNKRVQDCTGVLNHLRASRVFQIWKKRFIFLFIP